MTLSFPDYVSVDIIHTVGLAIGVIVILVVLYEFVRWRGVLTPIAKASKLGTRRWLRIFANTIVSDVVYQQISPKCPDQKWFSHSLAFWGFLLLAASTTVNYLTNPTGGPLPLTDPVRILGNAGGVMLVVGLLIVVYRICADPEKREVTYGADYLFIGLLLLAAGTGFGSEFASELNAVAWTYGVYVIHLLSSAAILLVAPFSRFVHAFGRPVIRLSERYLEALSREGIVKPSEMTAVPLLREE